MCMAVGVLTACVPKFASAASLSVVPYGSALRVEWPEAIDPDGLAIESYRVDVVEVARRPASVRRCDLAGLAPGDHEVVVTALALLRRRRRLVGAGRHPCGRPCHDEPRGLGTCGF